MSRGRFPEPGQIPCPLAANASPQGGCDWCGVPLPGYRARWCSDACAYSYADNHSVNESRKAAKRRDGNRCTECGKPQVTASSPLFADRRLEVHHIDPRNGDRSGWGCQHHLDGLRTLCHECHVKETTEWRREEGLIAVAKGEWGRPPCAVEDCGGQVVANGLCTKHSQRLRMRGSVDGVLPNTGSEAVLDEAGVREVRRRYAALQSKNEIASAMGVSTGVVRKVLAGTYKPREVAS